MPTYEVTYKERTALRPEVVRADGLEVLLGEGMLVFAPALDERRYFRHPAIPLRFVAHVVNTDTGALVYTDAAT